ncbi:MAG TPA: winged helix-turn-helix domain-containing protein [Thermoanaerobaculia bacterium]
MKIHQEEAERSKNCYVVGDLRVDPGLRRVERGTSEISLPGLSFDLLIALIEGAPEFLSTDRLISEVWKGQVVSSETVTQRVKLLRDALGDDSQNPRYVAGARGQGYRLIAPVSTADRAAPPTRSRARIATFVLLFVAGAALIGYGVWKKLAGEAPRVPGARPGAIAVLPFENRSTLAEDAFFADGIHDDLLTRLSRIPNLRVIARGSVLDYSGDASIQQIARELGVTSVLTGAVQRAGNQVRIQVQLIDAGGNAQLWAETYDRALTPESVFAIQSEISRAIVTNLQIALVPSAGQAPERAPTSSLPAYEAWLKARHEMARYTPEGLSAAVTHFQDAVSADASFAQAHVGLAETRLLQSRFRLLKRELALQLADASLERAFQLDPASAEALAAKGEVLRLRGDVTGAEAALEQAITLNPNLAGAFITYGWLRAGQGRTTEQMEMWRRAGVLDPRSSVARVHRAFTNARAGRNAEAEEELRVVIERDPDFPLAHVILGDVRRASGDQAGAVRHYRRALDLNSALPLAHSGLVRALIDLEADAAAKRAIENAWLVADTPELGPNLEVMLAVQGASMTQVQRERVEGWLSALRAVSPRLAAEHAVLLHLRAGRFTEARAELESADPLLGGKPEDAVDEGRRSPLRCTYAFTLTRLGETERGRAVALSVLEPMRADHVYTRHSLVNPVLCNAVLGNVEKVVASLGAAATHGVPNGWRSLVSRPELAELRGEPDLERIITAMRTEAARQRERVDQPVPGL